MLDFLRYVTVGGSKNALRCFTWSGTGGGEWVQDNKNLCYVVNVPMSRIRFTILGIEKNYLYYHIYNCTGWL